MDDPIYQDSSGECGKHYTVTAFSFGFCFFGKWPIKIVFYYIPHAERLVVFLISDLLLVFGYSCKAFTGVSWVIVTVFGWSLRSGMRRLV